MWVAVTKEKNETMFSQIAEITPVGGDPISTVTAAHLLPEAPLTCRSLARTWARVLPKSNPAQHSEASQSLQDQGPAGQQAQEWIWGGRPPASP